MTKKKYTVRYEHRDAYDEIIKFFGLKSEDLTEFVCLSGVSRIGYSYRIRNTDIDFNIHIKDPRYHIYKVASLRINSNELIDVILSTELNDINKYTSIALNCILDPVTMEKEHYFMYKKISIPLSNNPLLDFFNVDLIEPEYIATELSEEMARISQTRTMKELTNLLFKHNATVIIQGTQYKKLSKIFK